MTQTEVSRFRKVLEATINELDVSARWREAIVIEKSADELEGVFQAGVRDLAIHNLEAESIKLREARAALSRVEDGTFGICLECEEQISPKRLAALPSAAFCVACQELADRNHQNKNARLSVPMAA